MKLVRWVKTLLEYLGGSSDTPPEGMCLSVASWTWGLWWGVLACLIMVFCGQTSKFIYIDF
jgi:hypothetical protein